MHYGGKPHFIDIFDQIICICKFLEFPTDIKCIIDVMISMCSSFEALIQKLSGSPSIQTQFGVPFVNRRSLVISLIREWQNNSRNVQSIVKDAFDRSTQ